MADLSVAAYTIGELSKNLSSCLGKYQDPYGYLAGCTSKWVDLLTRNPAAESTDLAIIIAVADDTAVGSLPIYAAFASINGTKHRTFLLDGFFLHPEYQSTGIGALMLLRTISHSKSLVASGSPRDDARALYLATGFKELGPLRRYIYFYRPEIILRKIFRVKSLPSILSLPLAPIFRAYYLLRRRRLKTSLDFKLVAAFPEEIDALVQQRQDNYFLRDSQTLNWAMGSQENLFPFLVFRQSRCTGYVLLKTRKQAATGAPHWLPEMSVGNLLDYNLADETAVGKRELINFCISFFRQKRVELFECQCLDDGLGGVCSGFGMIRLGGNVVLFRPPPGAQVSNEDTWFLTHGEGDVILGEVTGTA